jgi:hypothetical protein
VLAAFAVSAPAQAALVSSTPSSTWQTDGKVNAIAVANGKIYIGGAFTHVRAPGAPSGGAVRNHLAALDLKTGALKPWNPGANDIVNALAVSVNGKTVYAGGHFTAVNGKTRLHVAAIATKGGTLRKWKANANGRVDAIRVTRTRVYLGGEFTTVKSHTRHRLAAVRTGSTAQLINWSPNANSAVFAIQLSATGKRLYVGGNFTAINGKKKQRHLSAVKTATGGIAKKFRVHPTFPVFGLAATAKVLYVSGSGNGGHVNAYTIASSTRRWGALTDGDVRAITLRQGVVYAAGHFNHYCQGGTGSGNPLVCTTPVGRRKALALNATGGGLTSWNPDANSVQGAFAIRGTRTRVLLGGAFTKVHGVDQQGFALFK